MKKGMILGRFQIFHNGHMRYLQEAMKNCYYMLIGITNPDPLRTSETEVARHRSQPSANPFTYYERMKMIQGVCKEVQLEHYDIVPIPLDFPEIIKYYVPRDILVMITVHDKWSLEKKSRLEQQGYEVKILFEEYGQEKLSSTFIRGLIENGQEFAPYVPNSVYQYLLTLPYFPVRPVL